MAVVVLREGQSLTEPEVIAHCAVRLARFKVPKRVIFIDRRLLVSPDTEFFRRVSIQPSDDRPEYYHQTIQAMINFLFMVSPIDRRARREAGTRRLDAGIRWRRYSASPGYGFPA